MKEMYFLKLFIKGKKLDVERINEEFSFSGAVHNRTENGDIWQAGVEFEDDLNGETEKFIKRIYEHRDFILGLSKCAHISLRLTVYADEVQINVHLSPESIEKLKALSLSLDISIMNLSEFYK